MGKAIKSAILVIFMVAMQGCGTASQPAVSPAPSGPDGGMTEEDRTPPRLTEFFPADGAKEVSVVATISATFDEEILPTSVSSTALQVLRNGVPVAGRVGFIENVLTFLPTYSLDYDSEFEVIVAGGLSDAAGNALESERSWSFQSESFSGELPIVRVDPLGETILDDPKIPARMTIEMPEGDSDYVGWIGIEIRGSSTQTAAKKQFGFETWDEVQEEREVSLLDMPEESDWILQANAFDPTLLRNYFALALSRATGRYAPRMQFAELFLALPEGDFHYWGVYAVMEKIKRDANRVPLKKLGPTDNAEPEVTGGYLLAMDKVHPGDSYFDTSRGTRLLHEYPKWEDITPDQAAWIQDFIEDFEANLYAPEFRDPLTGYRAYLDLDAAVDFFLVNEALKNIDAFAFSTFMSKERGGKLKLGPVWDFDLAMANFSAIPEAGDPEGWMLCDKRWIDRLVEDPDFVAAAAARYHALRAGPWSNAAIEALFENGLEELGPASDRNLKRWYKDSGFLMEQRVSDLRAWVGSRLQWMDSHVEGLCGI